MTKQEKIQEAYGIHWEFYKDKVSNDGWVNCRIIGNGSLIPIMEVNGIEMKGHLQRPKSLQGIENNNGWIKIENDLPEKTECHFYDIKNKDYWTAMVDEFGDFAYSIKATHYQPIQKPQLPIY